MKNGSMARMHPHSEIMTITPEMATQWLGRNTEGNRSIREGRVEAFARDMATGNWALTHQGVAFNRTGELIDGQHRLRAIVRANVPIQMLVSTGYQVEYDSPIDCGATRSAADLTGLVHSEIAILRCLVVLGSGRTNQRNGTTLAELQAMRTMESEAFEWARSVFLKCKTKSVGLRLSGWVAGACAYAWPLNPELMSGFVEQLRTGELLEAEDPAYTLRAWLGRGYKASSADIALVTLSAARFALRHDRVARLQAAPSGYLWICAQRRNAGLPNTPSASTTGTAAYPAPAETRRAKERARVSGGLGF